MAISLTADEVVEMPLDALALRILRDVDDTGEWNSYNWMNARQQSPEFSRRADALRAFEESWAWLRAKALLSRQNRALQIGIKRGRWNLWPSKEDWIRIAGVWKSGGQEAYPVAEPERGS